VVFDRQSVKLGGSPRAQGVYKTEKRGGADSGGGRETTRAESFETLKETVGQMKGETAAQRACSHDPPKPTRLLATKVGMVKGRCASGEGEG